MIAEMIIAWDANEFEPEKFDPERFEREAPSRKIGQENTKVKTFEPHKNKKKRSETIRVWLCGLKKYLAAYCGS